MLCQNCHSNEASTHVKRILNGQVEEYHLCGVCSQKLGYGFAFPQSPFNLDSFFGSFLKGSSQANQDEIQTPLCPGCGCSFHDIAQSGRVGCPECYVFFYNNLLPSIQKIHGKTHHVGKISRSAGPNAKAAARLDALRHELQGEIALQNYERAAELRDEIKALEEEGSNS